MPASTTIRLTQILPAGVVANISKIDGVGYATVSKINAVAYSTISKINGVAK